MGLQEMAATRRCCASLVVPPEAARTHSFSGRAASLGFGGGERFQRAWAATRRGCTSLVVPSWASRMHSFSGLGGDTASADASLFGFSFGGSCNSRSTAGQWHGSSVQLHYGVVGFSAARRLRGRRGRSGGAAAARRCGDGVDRRPSSSLRGRRGRIFEFHLAQRRCGDGVDGVLRCPFGGGEGARSLFHRAWWRSGGDGGPASTCVPRRPFGGGEGARSLCHRAWWRTGGDGGPSSTCVPRRPVGGGEAHF